MRSLDGNIDTGKAISLATSSADFQIAASGHHVDFNGIFFLFSSSVDSNGVPKPMFDSVNVVFRYHDAGGAMANIIVTQNPTLTQVTNVTVQPVFFASHPPVALPLGKS